MVLGRKRRLDLRFLRTFMEKPGGAPGETEARVRVYCRGCRRWKTVPMVGLRVTEKDTVDLQPYCHACRAILSRRES